MFKLGAHVVWLTKDPEYADLVGVVKNFYDLSNMTAGDIRYIISFFHRYPSISEEIVDEKDLRVVVKFDWK